jgi:ADP-ribose pyrophosphatase
LDAATILSVAGAALRLAFVRDSELLEHRREAMKRHEPIKAIQAWKRLDARLVLSATPWVAVYQEQVQLPSGRVLDDFYRVVLQDFVAVVASTATEQLVMVRCYKHGLGQVILSVPAGYLEPGETPLAAAQRELLEETGYAAAEWKELGSFVVDGNRHCNTMHLFLAKNAQWVKPCQLDGAEEVEVELVSSRWIVEAIRKGEIHHLVTASAITMALMVG